MIMKKKNGFSLIELLITLVILAVLGAVAIPIYTGYITGSARSEAKSNLQTLSLLLETYFADNNRYNPSADGNATYNWQEPATNNFSNTFPCGGTGFLPSFCPRQATSGTQANYDYQLVIASATTYTATATGVRGPVNGDSLTINQAGNKTGSW